VETEDVEGDAIYTPPMEGSRGISWFTFFMVIAAGGFGYLSYYEYTKNNAASGDLGKTRGDAQACADGLTLAKAHGADVDKQLADCTAARDAEKAKREENDKAGQEMASNLNATKAELDELRQQHADADKRLAAFKALGEKLRKMIDAGKLEVITRRGRMIVKLPAEVLFGSGSAQLSPDGQPPLKELAAVLKQFPDRRFMVAGHTDNVPIGPSSYKSNWELSTARAVTVTEFLASMGVNPARLAAAGYSEYDPIRSNNSDAGRAENRRIEIVLLPNVEEISGLAKAVDTANAKAAPKASK
jgi:chemotaxis protein MotB